ncbi:MAG: hypothetical protein EOO88_41250 [Pedobacter sp.]|nr:MAG: hypothetical protein EOO88_41250 [Pedobacter sp.]
MHPGTSASDRRFPLPALVFNLHEQFEELQAAEKHPSMKRLTRRRDKTLLNLAAETYQANGHIRSTQKESIYEANDRDYQKATIRIHHDATYNSQFILPVIHQ